MRLKLQKKYGVDTSSKLTSRTETKIITQKVRLQYMREESNKKERKKGSDSGDANPILPSPFRIFFKSFLNTHYSYTALLGPSQADWKLVRFRGLQVNLHPRLLCT